VGWFEWKISSTLWFVRWILFQILDWAQTPFGGSFVRHLAAIADALSLFRPFSHLDLDAGDTIGGSVRTAVRGGGARTYCGRRERRRYALLE